MRLFVVIGLYFTLLASLLFSHSTLAQDNWVQVDGYAPFSAGKLMARRQALVSAYREAISAGGIIEVKANSIVSNFSMVADVVNTRTHGYIKRYQMLSEGRDTEDNTLYKVTIKAHVVNAPDGDNEQCLSSFLSLIGVPKVLFLIAEPKQNSSTSSVESYMAENFRNVGYQVLSADDIKITNKITAQLIEIARSGNGNAAATVAKSINADIVITGKIAIEMNKMSGGTDIVANIGNVSLNVKAIIPGNGKVVDVVNARDRFMSVQGASELIAKEKAIAKTVNKITNKMMWHIPKYLSQQPRTMNLQLSKLNFDDIELMSTYLSNVDGIDDANLIEWSNGVANFSIDASYTGPKERDLIKLLKNKYPSTQVMSLKNYHVAMTF